MHPLTVLAGREANLLPKELVRRKGANLLRQKKSASVTPDAFCWDASFYKGANNKKASDIEMAEGM